MPIEPALRLPEVTVAEWLAGLARRGRGRAAGDGLDALVRTCAKRVLEQSWNEAAGYCRPNRRSYPHLWLWDSCFHAIAWFALGDPRGLRELEAVFKGQLANGFLPHMRYGKRTYLRGPLPGVSSFTQPPVYARALKVAVQAGCTPSPALLDAASRALDALWRDRMRDGLLVIVHPWEAGTDDSPRWDSWVGSTAWNRRDWTRFDRGLLSTTVFADDGRAVDNPEFAAAPAAFNAIAADAAMTLGELTGDPTWVDRGRALAKALDDAAWNSDEQLWSDIAFVGGGRSVHVPTLDAALPALCTTDVARASTALAQLDDPERFAATSGPRFVARHHPTYRPDQYWRGPAWPQLNYLAILAARHTRDHDLADQLAALTKRGCIHAGFAEYWNPETGRGLGARPQTWSAIAAAV